jgi:hypothetical protein
MARMEGYHSASPLVHSGKSKLFQNFAALHRTPCCFVSQNRGFEPHFNHEKSRANARLFSWLGWRDSNPRMPGPKPGALPLGHIPRYLWSIPYLQGVLLVF